MSIHQVLAGQGLPLCAQSLMRAFTPCPHPVAVLVGFKSSESRVAKCLSRVKCCSPACCGCSFPTQLSCSTLPAVGVASVCWPPRLPSADHLATCRVPAGCLLRWRASAAFCAASRSWASCSPLRRLPAVSLPCPAGCCSCLAAPSTVSRECHAQLADNLERPS